MRGESTFNIVKFSVIDFGKGNILIANRLKMEDAIQNV